MPKSVEKEEEKICLLSEENSNSTATSPLLNVRIIEGEAAEEAVERQGQVAQVEVVPDEGDDDGVDDENKENNTLVKGAAERAFFDEISKNVEDVVEVEAKASVSVASIEAVKDMLQEIESGDEMNNTSGKANVAAGGTGRSKMLISRSLPYGIVDVEAAEAASSAANCGGTTTDEEAAASDECRRCSSDKPAKKAARQRASASLVVDVHIQPELDLRQEQPMASEEGVVAKKQCKHSMLRFQRCYSDTTQASPKRKAKVRFAAPKFSKLNFRKYTF